MSDSPSIPQSQSGGKELPVGTRIEEFIIEKVLGSGGFGITYLVRDTSLNRQVVIKENLPSQFAHRDTTNLTVRAGAGREDQDNFRWSLENFTREAETLASLHHPGIVPVLRRFEALGTAYFVMPFVEGVALDALVVSRMAEGQPFSEEELRGLLDRTLDALAHLHDRGIYHRDIKPGNILITNSGIPVLIDFGSARQRLGERSMTVVESPGYTPFEQLQSRGNVGPWSDLYALGGTLCKVITGEAPPKANDRVFDDAWQPLVTRKELLTHYSAALLFQIDRSLAVRISDRWQETRAWSAALSGGPVGTAKKMIRPHKKWRGWVAAVCIIIPLIVWLIISSYARPIFATSIVVDGKGTHKKIGTDLTTVNKNGRVESEANRSIEADENENRAAQLRLEMDLKTRKEEEQRKLDVSILEKSETAAKNQFHNERIAMSLFFNEVGKQMVIMLRNSHINRFPFDEKLGQRFLDDYLKDLDSLHLYFTQEDVDSLREKYGDQLHTLLMQGNCMTVATEIYELYEKRVEVRIELVDQILRDTNFDFSGSETVVENRKDTPWPKNEIEATSLWRLRIKEMVLSETLRHQRILKTDKEQIESNPRVGEQSPKNKVSLGYKRFINGVKDVDGEGIAIYFLNAVARSYDPHTKYMSSREMDRFRRRMNNDLVGVGVDLQAEEDGATKIMGIVVGGPADRDGTLKLNDRIVAVDALNTGKAEDMIDIKFLEIDKVVDYILGKEGTAVALKVEPAGGPHGVTKVVVIQRDKVDDRAIGDIIEMTSEKGAARRLGMITLPSFYADFDKGKVSCSIDVEKILNRMVAEKIDGLVLDLRNNGGGSLEEVRRMAGFFIEHGPVVQVKNSLGQVQVKESGTGKPIFKGPMVVMTNKRSAMASEILAGALQDFNRAVIIGDSSTFGGGTVQQPMDIGRMLPLFAARNRAGFLSVTIQQFYRPSGSSTQMDGVAPQLVYPSLSDGIEIGEAFLEHPLPHDRIRPAPNFAPLDALSLFFPRLEKASKERRNASKDFSYVVEDAMKSNDRLKLNRLSLNIVAREKEIEDADKLEKERNVERVSRFEKMSEEDKKTMSFFRLRLDDLEVGGDLNRYEPVSENLEYMRRSENVAKLNETPKWPSGLDPMKREALMIAKDLSDITHEKSN